MVSENDLKKVQQNNSTGDSSKLDKKEIKTGGVQTTLRDEKKPLAVLDGKVVELKDLQETDPDSIETINILKGASAMVMYGSKAQNGVILVTTKKKWKSKKEKTSVNWYGG